MPFCFTVLVRVISFKVLQSTHGLVDSVKGVWRSNRQVSEMEIFDSNEKQIGAWAGKMVWWVKCMAHKQARQEFRSSASICACEEVCL